MQGFTILIRIIYRGILMKKSNKKQVRKIRRVKSKEKPGRNFFEKLFGINEHLEGERKDMLFLDTQKTFPGAFDKKNSSI